MRYSTLAAAAGLAQYASAFPAMHAIPAEDITKLTRRQGNTVVVDPAVPLKNFNAKAQYVSNKGKYAFVAPGKNDARGPCPGLNAMANHGYIPHNGVATITQFIEGTGKVFGMGVDLAAFLAVLGASIDGDGLSWSIGGANPALLVGNGLTGSHNKYESDVSPTRPDLYEKGNNYEVDWTQWKEFYDMQADKSVAESNYDLDILQKHRSKRFTQSIERNPYFFNGPFTGIAVQPAAYTFIYRFMSNKSAEHPDGKLDKDTLKAFFGVTENDDGSFSGGTGYERIPDNWYKRAIGSEYTIPFFQLDLVQEALADPRFLNVGGNTGEVNTFTGVDIADLTGGVFNGATLLEGNNLFCFAYQNAQQGLPDIVKTLLGTVGGGALGKTILSLGCPQLQKVDEDMLSKFPGYKKSV